MEYITSLIGLAVALYVVIKITNSSVTTTLVDTGTSLIEINTEELIFDAEQRLGKKLLKAEEAGALTQEKLTALRAKYKSGRKSEEL